MIRTVKTAVLWAGLATLGCAAAAASQPQTQPTNAPYWFVSDGGSSYLGVDIQDVTADRVAALRLKEERGVEVTMVDQDAPAGKAGLKEHDVILDFNGTAVEGAEQLRRLIREVPAGRTVALGISRDGNPMKISVQLADRGKIAGGNRGPKIFTLPRLPDIPRSDFPAYAFQVQTYSSTLGIQTENLSRQLGEFFGVKDGEGILVRSVEKGSAAEKAGIKAGDVIVRADNEKLSDRADLSHILRNHREGGKVSLGIVRDKREQTITIDLPHRGSDDSFFVWPNADQFKGNWEELQNELREMIDEARPETERLQLDARLALEKARQQVREVRPQIDQALRQGRQELRRAQKLMEEQRKELRKRIDTMI
jgi:serine protease Do